jgi:hypothetical protein
VPAPLIGLLGRWGAGGCAGGFGGDFGASFRAVVVVVGEFGGECVGWTGLRCAALGRDRRGNVNDHRGDHLRLEDQTIRRSQDPMPVRK